MVFMGLTESHLSGQGPDRHRKALDGSRTLQGAQLAQAKAHLSIWIHRKSNDLRLPADMVTAHLGDTR